MTTLIDKYNRHLNYLRISVTDRCNLRCIYCLPRGFIPKLSHEDVLSYEEILRLVRLGVRLGISKVRITGGEPLVRKGIYDFLRALSEIRGLSDISLTTNGVFLTQNIDKIRAAGIRRINISIDSLNPGKFEYITGRNCFEPVWDGIMSAYEAGFAPIKLNVVALNGINSDELTEIARLSFSYPFHIRFIEYMPIGKSELGTRNAKFEMLAPEIIKRIRSLGKLNPVENAMNDGPADRYKFEGAKGEIGIIRPLSHHFCYKCNRLRLTASGQLRACLLSDHQEDLKTPLRKGFSDKQISDIFVKTISMKPFKHQLSLRHSDKVSSQMSAIGG
ncbi:GTP 3',8-cyclase MoaA [Desulfococcaceae bacterium HSG8]|nr:GTP 3',8-cyclase MoaA [Desulfococcaceae bacterium HSG8]